MQERLPSCIGNSPETNTPQKSVMLEDMVLVCSLHVAPDLAHAAGLLQLSLTAAQLLG